MTQVHDDEIDGVGTRWVDSGRPTLFASLLFRFGSADESLVESGWQHLVEHLALHGREGGSLDVNGSVSPLLTTFAFHGPADEVVSALGAVTGWLADPDLGELDRERGVLAAEATLREGPVTRALGMRYGATGPGVAAWGDPGLRRASAEELRARVSRAFVTGNAALALDGPPPAGLRLHLPPGEPVRARPAVAVEESQGAYLEPSGLVLSGVVARSGLHTMLPAVLEATLREEFRDRAGAAYAPFGFYEGVDEDQALVLAGTDVAVALAPSLLGTTLDLLGRLATDGPPPDLLARLRAQGQQAVADPYNVGGLALRAAAMSLDGRPTQQLDEVRAELAAVTPDSLAPGLAAFRDTLLVGAPAGTAPHTWLRLIEHPTATGRATGARSVNWPADPTRLEVTREGATIGDTTTVRRFPIADLAGYLVWDNGTRALVRHDGWSLAVVPGAWASGERQVQLLDTLVPGHLHLPQPAQTAPAAEVQRAGHAQRWWGGVRRTLPLPVLLTSLAGLAVVVATAAAGIALLLADPPRVLPALALLGMAVFAFRTLFEDWLP